MARPTLYLLVVGSLGLLAFLQVARLIDRNFVRTPLGPSLGEGLDTLPGAAFTIDPIEPFVKATTTGGDTCSLVVVIDPFCSACRRMKETWNRRYAAWRTTTGVPLQPFWVGASDSAQMVSFFAGAELEGVQRIALGLSEDGLREELGVYATPTVYLFDRAGRLRLGSLGFNLPPADSVQRICGPSPR